MTSRRPHRIFLLGLAVLLGLVACAIADPKVAAAGWLVGFAFWMQILTGSLCLLMIHRLTSGKWGEIIAPVAVPLAAAIPLLIFLAIPLFLAIPSLYAWTQPLSAVKSDVLSFYLNRPIFILRSLIALVGWSVLAFWLPRTPHHGQLLAALGLVFYAVTISTVSIDWYLSIQAPFTSSSFGASVTICSLVASLAWTAVWLPAAEEESAIGDLGALLLATVLGLTYIDFMAVLVVWYGDLPREAAWFAMRSVAPWSALAVVAFVLSSLVPTVALIQARFRNRRRSLRYVGAATLVGLAIYDVYLVVPPFGVTAIGPAVLAVVGSGLVLRGVLPILSETLAPPRKAIDAP